jgi:hypothetical protein
MQTGCKLLCKEGYFLEIDGDGGGSDMFAPGYSLEYDDIGFLTEDAVGDGRRMFDGEGQGEVEDITGVRWMGIAEYQFTQEDVDEFGGVSVRFGWTHRPKGNNPVFEEAQVRFLHAGRVLAEGFLVIPEGAQGGAVDEVKGGGSSGTLGVNEWLETYNKPEYTIYQSTVWKTEGDRIFAYPNYVGKTKPFYPPNEWLSGDYFELDFGAGYTPPKGGKIFIEIRAKCTQKYWFGFKDIRIWNTQPNPQSELLLGQKCIQCNAVCKTCEGSADSCLTCWGTKFEISDMLAKGTRDMPVKSTDGMLVAGNAFELDPKTKKCTILCEDGYYKDIGDPIDQKCLPCDATCETCTDNSRCQQGAISGCTQNPNTFWDDVRMKCELCERTNKLDCTACGPFRKYDCRNPESCLKGYEWDSHFAQGRPKFCKMDCASDIILKKQDLDKTKRYYTLATKDEYKSDNLAGVIDYQVNQTCGLCDEMCGECDGPGPNSCTSCNKNFVLITENEIYEYFELQNSLS